MVSTLSENVKNDLTDQWILKTEDGSPTLVDLNTPNSEPMHSIQGAWSETLHVYEPVLTEVLDRKWKPRFLSVGLGLGYIEMMLFSKLASRYVVEWPEAFELLTLEKNRKLETEFLTWFLHRDGSAPSPLWKVYDENLKVCARHFHVDPKVVQFLMKSSFLTQKWQFGGELTNEVQFPEKFSGIFFDAYSKNTSPELWEEGFFGRFLKNAASPTCVFATYAANALLKRSLFVNGFLVEPRKGFGGKRECTLAFKSLIN